MWLGPPETWSCGPLSGLARGWDMEVPSDRILDAAVERIITSDPLPAARIAGESLVRTRKSFSEISKLFRQRLEGLSQ